MKITEVGALLDCLLVVRESLETGSRYSGGSADIRGAYLHYESVRFPFASFIAEYGRDGHDIRSLNEALSRLTRDLEMLLRDEKFTHVAQQLPTSRKPKRREMVSYPLWEVLQVGARTVDLKVFLTMIHQVTSFGIEGAQSDLFGSRDVLPSQEEMSRLRKIVPKQKISPVRFDVVDSILVVQPKTSEPAVGDDGLATSAKNELVERGTKLIDQLQRSNCDPRLIESVVDLQKQIESGRDIVRLGLSNISFAMLGSRFEAELPAAISAMVQSHSVGLAMYVAQFPDWAKFTENAAAVELAQVDIKSLTSVLKSVINATESTGVAEAEVPRTLRQLKLFLENPQDYSSRAALAAIRTIENLVIKTFGYAADYIDKTASTLR